MAYINYYNSSFSFLFTGSSFPSTGTSRFALNFNAPANVTVDFGNGVQETYATIGNNFTIAASPLPLPADQYPRYDYPDGLNIDRRITITMSDADKLKLIGMHFYFFKMPAQFLTVSFNNYPNLATLELNNTDSKMLGIDPSFLTLSSFITYQATNTFNPLSSYYGTVPVPVLSKSTLTTLQVGDPAFPTKTFADSNLDKIAISYPNLHSLFLNVGLFDDNFGDGPFPSNFSTIATLNLLGFNATKWTVIPDEIADIPSFTVLALTYCIFTGWGDLSPIASRLTTLSLNGSISLSSTLPAWFSSLTACRIFNWANLGKGSTNINTVFSNLYAVVVANAAITGANTLPFRGWSMFVAGDTTVTNGVIPSGTYQQPLGYVQGSSNGSPVSSQEIIWVLEHQYGFNINYRTV